jgi:hypothetical protein
MVVIVNDTPADSGPAEPEARGSQSQVSLQQTASEALKSSLRAAFAIVTNKCVDELGVIIGYDQEQQDMMASAKEKMTEEDLRTQLVPVFSHFLQAAIDEMVAAGDPPLSGLPGILLLPKAYSAALFKWVDAFPLFMDDPRVTEINKRYGRLMMTTELLATPIGGDSK